jgi:hypothetical protein
LILGLSACEPGVLQAIDLIPTTLDTGLVAHWTFDEGVGTVVPDHSLNHLDGQLTGGTWISDGRFGGALHIDPGNYMSVSSFPNATSSWSVAGWVRLVDEIVSTSQWETVISTEGHGGWEINVDRSKPTPGAHFGFWKGPNQGDYNYVECFCLAFAKWMHAAFVVDGQALTLSVYVDGTLSGTTSIAQTIAPNNATLYVGRWPLDSDATRPYAGDVDDIVIYDRALVPEEIAVLQQHPPPDPG